jgi:tRNA-specific 2-thiouridylase
VQLLKVGPHFRLSPVARVVSGRDQEENQRVAALARPDDVLFEVQGWGSPITLLRGEIGAEACALAAAITARYSDAPGRAAVSYGPANQTLLNRTYASPLGEGALQALRI